jgi:hypothetical protein
MRNTIFGLTVLATACLLSSASGAIKLVAYAESETGERVQLSDEAIPTGDSLFADPAINANPVWSLMSSGGKRYVRFRMDLRTGQNNVNIHSAAGNNSKLYNPSTGTNVFQISGLGGGFLNTLREGNAVASFATSSGVTANGWTANDGIGPEKINWLMVRPDDSSTASPIQAVALGFLWTDTDLDGKISSGDVIALKYGVTATSFEEIDTADKLDAAVGNVNKELVPLVILGILL